MQTVKLIILAGRWDRHLLLPIVDKAQHQLPRCYVPATQTAQMAASRLALQHGLQLAPEAWTLIPSVSSDYPGEVLLTARAPLEAYGGDSSVLLDRQRWVQTELTLCDIWVNPNRFEPGLLSRLERARQALGK